MRDFSTHFGPAAAAFEGVLVVRSSRWLKFFFTFHLWDAGTSLTNRLYSVGARV